MILKKIATYSVETIDARPTVTGEIWENQSSNGIDRYRILINGAAPRHGGYLFADLPTAEFKLKFELRMAYW